MSEIMKITDEKERGKKIKKKRNKGAGQTMVKA